MPSADTENHNAVQAASNAVLALEEEAGISAEAERARDVFGFDLGSETPLGSEASKRESRAARKYEHETAARRMRVLYFGLPNPDLRRRLIGANRKVDAERHLSAWTAVTSAHAAIGAAFRNEGTSPVATAVGGGIAAASVWTTSAYAGTGAALALLAGMGTFLPGAIMALICRRDAAIRKTEQALAIAEESAQEAYVLAPAFTAQEERSGEADPNLQAAGVVQMTSHGRDL